MLKQEKTPKSSRGSSKINGAIELIDILESSSMESSSTTRSKPSKPKPKRSLAKDPLLQGPQSTIGVVPDNQLGSGFLYPGSPTSSSSFSFGSLPLHGFPSSPSSSSSSSTAKALSPSASWEKPSSRPRALRRSPTHPEALRVRSNQAPTRSSPDHHQHHHSRAILMASPPSSPHSSSSSSSFPAKHDEAPASPGPKPVSFTSSSSSSRISPHPHQGPQQRSRPSSFSSTTSSPSSSPTLSTSPSFAGAKWQADPPSPRSLPKPPSRWLGAGGGGGDERQHQQQQRMQQPPMPGMLKQKQQQWRQSPPSPVVFAAAPAAAAPAAFPVRMRSGLEAGELKALAPTSLGSDFGGFSDSLYRHDISNQLKALLNVAN